MITPRDRTRDATTPRKGLRWPDFLIVGAARCGTTSLHYYLKDHPDIYMPRIKELHFFAHLDPSSKLGKYANVRAVRDEADYLSMFAAASPSQLIGEACPSYLYDQGAPTRIREKSPEAKIVIVLREPIDRAYSHYLMHVREGVEWKPFFQAVLEDRADPRKTWGSARLYVELGLYYEQVKRYMDVFGRGRVRVYLYEDLMNKTVSCVGDLCAFLGVPFYEGKFFDPNEKHNVYAAPRSDLSKRLIGAAGLRSLLLSVLPKAWLVRARERLLLTKGPKPPLDERSRELLGDIYRDDILMLQHLINRDLSAWSNPLPEKQRRPAIAKAE